MTSSDHTGGDARRYEDRPDGGSAYVGRLRGDGLRVAVACSRFNRLVTDRLLDGAHDGLVRHGVDASSITVATVYCTSR